MENNAKKEEKSLVYEIGKELIGDACGYGAGLIIGAVALAFVEASPAGKGLKLLMKLGAAGLELTGMFTVRKEVRNYLDHVSDSMITLTDSIKALVEPKKEPEKTEGAVQ